VVRAGMRLPAPRLQSSLHRFEKDLLVDPLLSPDLLDDADQLSVHGIRNLPAILRLAGPGDLRLQPRLRDVGPSKLHPLALPSPSRVPRVSRPLISAPPASQHRTCRPTAHWYSRSFRSWRSSPGDETSRS